MEKFPETVKAIQRQTKPNIYTLIINAQNIEDFRTNLFKICTDEIARRTIGQSDVSDWYFYRKGVITATLTKRICYFMETFAGLELKKREKKRRKINFSISKIEEQQLFFPAVIYGRQSEDTALDSFWESFCLTHQHVIIERVGLRLHESRILGGSVDAVLWCSCCKPRIIEVKCPFRLKHESIQRNWECLEYLSENGELKENHAYYFQIQTYLGLYQYDEAVLIIWSRIDHIQIRVPFNKSVWDKILTNSTDYYFNYYLKSFF